MVLADYHPLLSLVVNIAIAVGTLLAAAVALGLGVSARRAELRRDRREGAAERRQITVVITPTPNRIPGSAWATVDIVNESSDLITNIGVQLYSGALGWLWVGALPPTYLAAKSSFRGAGSFHTSGSDGQPDGSTYVFPENGWSVKWVLSWLDAHGTLWARADGADPYPTTAAYPGRQLPDRKMPPRGRLRVLGRRVTAKAASIRKRLSRAEGA